jgi:hypothetical protein
MSNMPKGGGFGQFVPGFEFLQSLTQPASSGSPGMGGMPNLGSWVAPTFNVEDLEKRIEELKAVHFWLDQNSKALSATIQAMEVQKMTLATLRDLNVNFGDVAKAGEAARSAAAESMSKGFAGFEVPKAAEAAPVTEDEPAAPPLKDPSSEKTASEQIDPVQWWGALQQQFQNIAVNAMQDLSKKDLPTAAKKAAVTKAPPKRAPAKKKAAARKKPASKTRER